jgi:hypothetical protein
LKRLEKNYDEMLATWKSHPVQNPRKIHPWEIYDSIRDHNSWTCVSYWCKWGVQTGTYIWPLNFGMVNVTLSNLTRYVCHLQRNKIWTSVIRPFLIDFVERGGKCFNIC